MSVFFPLPVVNLSQPRGCAVCMSKDFFHEVSRAAWLWLPTRWGDSGVEQGRGSIDRRMARTLYFFRRGLQSPEPQA